MASAVLGPYRERLLQAVLAAHTDAPTVPEKAKLFRGLADPTRLMILQLLADRPMPVREVARAIDDSVVGAAAHLACLEACGLIRCHTREGERYYSALSSVRRLVRAADAVLAGEGMGVRTCPRYSG